IKGLSGKHFEPKTVTAFEDLIGVYPVGTMVRLTTNEVGIVTNTNATHKDRPVVKITYGEDGSELDETKELDLAKIEVDKLSIIGSVDPLSRNMDMGGFFAKEGDREAT
ncbi:MAG: hypothetical protein KAR06_10795, partial [Deltaproteobacteria bacterium]|nr:hypothetical protein [Deltaproteobacteria bacterium]